MKLDRKEAIIKLSKLVVEEKGICVSIKDEEGNEVVNDTLVFLLVNAVNELHEEMKTAGYVAEPSNGYLLKKKLKRFYYLLISLF